jgi:polar amino acid transport system substrate-binding protein
MISYVDFKSTFEELTSGLFITVSFSAYVFLISLGSAIVIAWVFDSYKKSAKAILVLSKLVRSVPTMLLIFSTYYLVPSWTGLRIDGYGACLIALSVIGSFFMFEIIRSGLSTVSGGVREAARALALPGIVTVYKIILPALISATLPSFINYFSEIVKNSALVAVVGVADITYIALVEGGRSYRYFEALMAAGVMYFVLINVIASLSWFAEAATRRRFRDQA